MFDGVIAFGSANDTGPGPDRVKFYSTDEGLEQETRWRDTPTVYEDHRVESVR
jgi:hypothetical protein